MTTATIYHNPRCSKSRQALALLEERGVPTKVIEYLKTPPTINTLKALTKKLNVKAHDIIRKNEEAYKQLNLNDNLSDQALLSAIADEPKLLQRPIVVIGNAAVIGRPPENILEIL